MLTELICIIDESGSMNSIVNDAIGGFNSFLSKQKDEIGEVNVTLVLFNTKHQFIYENEPISNVKDLTIKNYSPSGGTALLDAIGSTIDSVGRRLSKLENKPDKIIVTILTDGEENSSKKYSLSKINSMITHQREKYSWEFIFLAANQDAFVEGQKLGIASVDTVSFECTASGIQNIYDSLHTIVTSYRSN